MTNIRHAIVLRVRAVRIIVEILGGRAQDTAVDQDRERYGRHGLVEELAIGTIRQALGGGAAVAPFLKRPFKKADQDVYALILMGLYQARHMGSPPAVAVSEAVATTEALNKPWAKGVVNAVLRATLAASPATPFVLTNHPAWLIERLRAAWPDDYVTILEANDRRAPLSIRVDTQKISRDAYLELLAAAGIRAEPHTLAPTAIIVLEATPVLGLPGFREGLVSVQDAAAQLAAPLLAACPGESVLDACAAPGGKTGHIAQSTPGAIITAVDREPARVLRLHETLTRLDLATRVRVLTEDLAHTDLTESFQRILLDAPCSATGVIRRHPDIKLHRRPEDVAALILTQGLLLDRLWQRLTPGGTLVYATCSILPEENETQINRFLERTPDAAETLFSFSAGRRRDHGWQFLPGDAHMDGFFYARLIKKDLRADGADQGRP